MGGTSDGTVGFSGGSRGAGGYRYQALACAYVSAHALACHPLGWMETLDAVPLAVEAETGGPGDDLRVELLDGGVLEVQAKRGLKKGAELWSAVGRLARGLAEDGSLRCVLLVNTTASLPVREHLMRDLQRISMGRYDGLKSLTQEMLRKLRNKGISTDADVIGRLSVAVADLGDGSEGEGTALALLAGVVDKPRIRDAWVALKDDGMRLAESRGRREVLSLRTLLEGQGIPSRDPAEANDPSFAAAARGEYAVPPIPRPFVGRACLVTSLARRLREGNSVVASADASSGPPTVAALFGLPGSGKTAVAAAVAEDLRESFDTVLWASLGPNPSMVREFSALGRQLDDEDLSDSPSTLHASRRLGTLLRDRKALLIVDDAWKAADATPFAVAPPGCAILFTTRSPSLAAELAAGGHAEESGTLDGASSLELLKALTLDFAAEGTDPQNEDPEDRAALERLAANLGGLPLALRVAGRLLWSEARLGLGLAELIEDLGRGEGLLAAKAPADLTEAIGEAAPTVAALLARSTDALEVLASQRFARLGVLAPKPTSFDLQAAEEIWGLKAGSTTEGGASDARGTLRELSEAGLVEPDGRGKFTLHPVIRMHARRLLSGSPDAGSEAAVLHARRFLGMLRSANALFAGGRRERETAATLFDTEWENVRNAQHWASSRAATPATSLEDAELGGPQGADQEPTASLDIEADHLLLDYADAAGAWLARRADFPERNRWLEDAVAASRRLAARAATASAGSSAGSPALPSDQTPAVTPDRQEEASNLRSIGFYRTAQARHLFALGVTRFYAGDLSETLRCLELSRGLYADLKDRVGEAKAVGATAAVFQRRGDYGRAEEVFQEALAVLDAAPDGPPEVQFTSDQDLGREHVRQRGVVLGNMGTLYKNMGKTTEAAKKNREAMRAFREISDLGQIGAALNNLGALRSELEGDVPGALRAFSAALHLFRTLRDRHGEAHSLLALAREHANAGEHETAEERASALIAVCEQLGDPSMRGWALAVLGSARLGLKDPASAAGIYREALDLSRDTQDGRLEIMMEVGLGRAALANEDPAKALDRFEEGLAAARSLPLPAMVGQILFDKAQALDALGRTQEALAVADEAMDSREKLELSEVRGIREWLAERSAAGR